MIAFIRFAVPGGVNLGEDSQVRHVFVERAIYRERFKFRISIKA